jgi:hypothetical protein
MLLSSTTALLVVTAAIRSNLTQNIPRIWCGVRGGYSALSVASLRVWADQIANSDERKRFICFISVLSRPGTHTPFPKMGVRGVFSACNKAVRCIYNHRHLATELSMSRALSLHSSLCLRDILLGDLYFCDDCTVVIYRKYHMPC